MMGNMQTKLDIKGKSNAYILAFIISVAVAVLLLILAAYLPQDGIDTNVKFSAEIMLQEGNYPAISDRSSAGTLDYFSDALMLMESKAMTKADLETVFSNPRFRYEDKLPVECLYEYVNDEEPVASSYYVRYWMGFRSVLRALLLFFNYYQIKRYVAFAFFALFSTVICLLSDKVNSKIAFCFALSIALVRPTVITDCLQYACCYIIAFAAMLWVPWVASKKENVIERLFFFEIGIITMYFDFYTTPIITLGFPLMYLYLLCQSEEYSKPIKSLLYDSLVWLTGYGLMWIAKLVLTTLFTSHNGIENGFNSLLGWLNPADTAGNEGVYSAITALLKVITVILADKKGVVVYAIAAIGIGTYILKSIKCRTISLGNLRRNKYVLIIGLLPLLWFAIAAKPTAVHASFQYRSVALMYWGMFSWLASAYKTNIQDPGK